MISTKEAVSYVGGWFLRIRLISTEEADFYGEGPFLGRRLISPEKAHFYRGGQFLCNRLTLAWKIRTISLRKQVFIQDGVCFTVWWDIVCFDNTELCFDNIVLCFDNTVLCFNNIVLCCDNTVFYCFFRGQGNESCNLIGSLPGQYFPISAHGPR